MELPFMESRMKTTFECERRPPGTNNSSKSPSLANLKIFEWTGDTKYESENL